MTHTVLLPELLYWLTLLLVEESALAIDLNR